VILDRVESRRWHFSREHYSVGGGLFTGRHTAKTPTIDRLSKTVTSIATTVISDMEQTSFQPASKTASDVVDLMSWGSLLQTEAVATTKARLPTEERREAAVVREDAAERRLNIFGQNRARFWLAFNHGSSITGTCGRHRQSSGGPGKSESSPAHRSAEPGPPMLASHHCKHPGVCPFWHGAPCLWTAACLARIQRRQTEQLYAPSVS